MMNAKKNIYFILAEENLFHPYFFLKLINTINYEKYSIVGVSVAKESYRKGFLYHLNQQYKLWGFIGFISIAIISIIRGVLDKLHLSHIYSIESIAKFYKIPFLSVLDVNDPSHINIIKKQNTDIIISSSGQIFKKELLSAPRIACINRHTALLPKYGGVLPVFWAMFHDEKIFGASVHIMIDKIDQGDILYQESIPLIKNNSLFANYILGFNKSVVVTLKALENLSSNIFVAKFQKNEKQYFSFPNLLTIKEFKKRYKSFSLSDIYLYKNSIRYKISTAVDKTIF